MPKTVMLFVNWNNENHRKENEVLSHSPRRGRTARRSLIVIQSIQSPRVWYFSLMNIQWLNISPLDIWNAEWFCNRTGNIPLRITLTDFRCLFPDIQIFKDYMDLWYSSAGVKRFIWTAVEVLFRLRPWVSEKIDDFLLLRYLQEPSIMIKNNWWKWNYFSTIA